MRKYFEKLLIKKLLKGSGLSKKDINLKEKTINLGLYGLALPFFEPRHDLILYALIKLYNYKCYQQEFVITIKDYNSNIISLL